MKMKDELDRRLSENKYELWLLLEEIAKTPIPLDTIRILQPWFQKVKQILGKINFEYHAVDDVA